MGNIIKTFDDSSFLEYDYGSFDQWCVYLTVPGKKRTPPRDTEYFDFLKRLAEAYTTQKVYDDYIQIYNLTGKEVSQSVLTQITNIASSYGADKNNVDIIFTILYLAMIAEENKANTKLGKRIKRLGIFKLLFENSPVSHAANFMRGMNWRDIDVLCKERGF